MNLLGDYRLSNHLQLDVYILLIIGFSVNGGDMAKRSFLLSSLIIFFYHNSYTSISNRTM
jgi:hypothetical protein